VHRYLPSSAKEGLRHWLQSAFAAGSVSDVRLRMSGALDDWPYPRGKPGQFVVTAKGKDLVLDYAGRWPRIEALDATGAKSG